VTTTRQQPQPDEQTTEELETPSEETEPGQQVAAKGPLPSLPTPSLIRRQPPTTSPSVSSPPESTETSSQASTDQPEPRPRRVIPPKDLEEAVRQASGILLVIAGQVGAIVHRRVSGPQIDRRRWLPTAAESEAIQQPVARIARRHIQDGQVEADTVDVCLAGAAAGAYVMRAAFDLGPHDA